ncbi:formylglycine-generating enzyme family protein [Sphingobium sp. CR2-8]|uniref:formylglycine-generating enzyme family protein n=1 Tax=Sphingobium sp. CR2-8 TaxID=1306534 RepID=UPI002DB8AA2A|nr:formylglycine-generating enzyme family protein [Sphingobium sp. CR2-8]MEC3911420.1 formylglycine-generating enzyme family protein [Sphingobium sp. CR2-8]
MKILILALLAVCALAQSPVQAKTSSPSKPGTIFRDCADCSQMVVVGPGRFTMGADGGEAGRYEGPVHDVTIRKAFAIGVVPVTYAQFAAFVKATGHKAATDCILPRSGSYAVAKGVGWADPALGRKPRAHDPVVCIDWRDATAYVAWIAKKTGKPYRLLSEAEWEYAARAGAKSLYPWGEDPADACRYANLLDASAAPSAVVEGKANSCSDGYPTLAPVGSFAPNAFGVRDMIGNVWTWTQDCYVMPYPAVAVDERPYEAGACDRRSVRGASWATNVTRARPTFRGRDPVDRVSQLFGLRIAMDLP